MAEKKTKKAEDINLITGETRSGIKFSVDKRVKDDVRVMHFMTQMQNKSLDTMTQSQALFSLLELMFGKSEGLTIFLSEVAAHHNGVADVNSLIEELTDLFDTIRLKNS